MCCLFPKAVTTAAQLLKVNSILGGSRPSCKQAASEIWKATRRAAPTTCVDAAMQCDAAQAITLGLKKREEVGRTGTETGTKKATRTRVDGRWANWKLLWGAPGQGAWTLAWARARFELDAAMGPHHSIFRPNLQPMLFPSQSTHSVKHARTPSLQPLVFFLPSSAQLNIFFHFLSF